MARHHRRHRRAQAHKLVESIQPVELTPKLADRDSANRLSLVKHDLIKTAVISLLLVIGLVVAYWLNQRINWTLPLGSSLYRIIHIR